MIALDYNEAGRGYRLPHYFIKMGLKKQMKFRFFMVVLGMGIVAYRIKDYSLIGDCIRFLF